MTKANVFLWDEEVGTVKMDDVRNISTFQYNPDFIKKEVQISPLMMPLRKELYEFPTLEQKTFKRLPGLLADSLPDKFGNATIDAWTKLLNFDKANLDSVERLQVIGDRGMGAIEYKPSFLDSSTEQNKVNIAEMVACSNRILNNRSELAETYSNDIERKNIKQFVLVGTSAGGSRAKAILGWNPKTDEFHSDQCSLPEGFEHWLIKFDGIRNNRDKEQADSQGYGKIEFAYYLMALKAGIEMTECRLHHEGELSHFMTKRFDRSNDGSKIHMQSLCGIAHMDFNQAGLYSYEDAIHIMKQLHLPQRDLEQFVLRAMFNVVGRNQDDHVKNIAFLMNQSVEWRLSPAFDVTYAYDPTGAWTSQHQMSVNGKRDNFVKEDLISLSNVAGIKRTSACEMLETVLSAIRLWPDFAYEAGVDKQFILILQANHQFLIKN